MGSLSGSSEVSAEDVDISPASRATAEISAREWNDFVTRFGASQDRFLDILNDRAGYKRRLVGEANAAAMEGAGITPTNTSATLRTGSRTGGISATGDVRERASQFRRGLGAAFGTINPATREREVRGKLKAAAIGRGLQDSAILSSAGLGRDATMLELERSNRELAQRYGLTEAVFTGVGAYAGTRSPFVRG